MYQEIVRMQIQEWPGPNKIPCHLPKSPSFPALTKNHILNQNLCLSFNLNTLQELQNGFLYVCDHKRGIEFNILLYYQHGPNVCTECLKEKSYIQKISKYVIYFTSTVCRSQSKTFVILCNKLISKQKQQQKNKV